MPARRLLLIVGLTAILGAALSPAQAIVTVPETYGVTFQTEDEFGNRLEGQAFYRRIADTDSQMERYAIFCEVHALPGSSVFPNVSVGAAVGINPSNPNVFDADKDGCYLTLDGIPVFNAPGIGASGEEAATSSLRNTGAQFYGHDSRFGGTFQACIRVQGLFTNGAVTGQAECGNQQMEV